ncbi:MAG: hypothetical protein WA004_10030 [Saprospiraceae bacterium]
MKHANHSNAATVSTESKGKEKVILLLIGLIGAAGLVFVLNSGSGKSAFSQNDMGSERMEVVAQN